MAAVCQFLFKRQLHQFLGRRAHILEALSEGNDREAHALKVLHHLHGSPAVEGDLTDVEAVAEPFDEFLDVSVVDDVALRGFEISLTLPHIVGNMVALDAKVERLLRPPEIWQDAVFVVLVKRREYQHECRDVRGGGQVKSAVADASFQIVLGNSKRTGVPLVHRHPSDRLLYPLIEP